jgi:hypothetical protein
MKDISENISAACPKYVRSIALPASAASDGGADTAAAAAAVAVDEDEAAPPSWPGKLPLSLDIAQLLEKAATAGAGAACLNLDSLSKSTSAAEDDDDGAHAASSYAPENANRGDGK